MAKKSNGSDVDLRNLRAVKSKVTKKTGRNLDPDMSKLEGQSKAEIETLRKKYRAIKEADVHAAALLRDSNDTEFWVCVVFQNREQKAEFLQKTKLIKIGDKYLNGMRVAETLGIELETPIPKLRKHVVNKTLLEFTE